MLIRSWDRGEEAEWRAWLAEGRDFGLLAANGPPGAGPLLTPTHFLLDADRGEILIHLAAPNPLWAALRADPHATLAVTDDYAFAPGHWRATGGTPPEHSTPTSYYASVQFDCTAEILDDPADKAEVLTRQLAHFQPETPIDPIVPGSGPFGGQLPGIRALRLTVVRVRAKFKYDDKKPPAVQAVAAERLAERALPRDAGARAQLLRRAAARAPGCPVD
ncbi:FMN-binding negative transcriptional regulator [Streptomyces sp. NPDC092296]|uniref:FMN-binding negative transcriptional regulator n=1 Tax=Streptomyces sp. NPDC092296 TaxID=3366012 RepID=UPI00381F9542